MQGLDEIDYQLIHLLQENARTPIKHLAEAVFMSPPAVAARIARLEKNGVIKGYRPIINLDMFGYNIMAYVNLQLVPGDKAR
ncbi:MAG: AsnC family transcriptional regulator, partial [Clostridia bacterium]